MNVKRLVTLASCTTIMIVGKFALLLLPNIELVTFCLIIFTLVFTLREALLISSAYTILEIIIWGLSEQFFIWTLIVLLTFLLKNVFKKNFIIWAMYSGFLGLTFGFFCSIPYLVIADLDTAISRLISGLFFDVVHMIGNYIFMLGLGEIVYKILKHYTH